MDKPQRADARRNRERILQAARAVFLEEGEDVQMEPIARRAGVGIGTVYRNFPTKQALVDEVASQWIGQRSEGTARALATADPRDALHTFVLESAESMYRDSGIRRVINNYDKVDTAAADAIHLTQLGELLDRVQAAGVVRADVTPADLFAMMCGLAMAIFRGANYKLCAEVMLKGLEP